MKDFWLGRLWSDYKEWLSHQRKPYQLITYQSDRSRFQLSAVYRVIDLCEEEGLLKVTIAAEQKSLL